jgi:hypothetical protein
MLGFQVKNKKVLLILFAIAVAIVSFGVLILTNS